MLAPINLFKPSSKIFYWPFQGDTSFVDLLCFCSVLCLLFLCAHLFICALWSPAGKGLISWLSFVVSNCEFITFPLVSLVRWGTWFLIFAPLLTLCFWCFRVCSLLPCGHLLRKGWPLGSCWWCLLYFCHFPMLYPGSGVVLDCIVSWSLPSFLLIERWHHNNTFTNTSYHSLHDQLGKSGRRVALNIKQKSK